MSNEQMSDERMSEFPALQYSINLLVMFLKLAIILTIILSKGLHYKNN